ncbi:MAG: DUF3500 domain-containing protein [Planctomycetaceae bacterium]
MKFEPACRDCQAEENHHAAETSRLNRRRFVQTVGAAAVAASLPRVLSAGEKETEDAKSPENLVEKLYHSLSETQRKSIAFPWDYTDERGLLRMHVSNNWHITEPKVNSDFFTADQRDIIEALFFGLYQPDWHANLRKQLQDDAGGYGKQQSIALFGEPGKDKFEFVMTGRHLTIRCDGNSTEHTAFGGPIFYGHAAQGFNEAADHPGNVYWEQALKANALYQMLDGKQRDAALIEVQPDESDVGFRAEGKQPPGIAVTELSSDQKEHLQKVLDSLLAPYRTSDQEEALACLQTQGGLDRCALSFYKEGDTGNDGVWDVWRLEGPSFVWHFRGSPHVHVWVNIADSRDVKISTAG